MSRMTIGAPCSAIVAIRLPSADVARSRSPLGPSVWLAGFASTMVAIGAPASPVTTTSRSSSIQTGGAATTGRSSAISKAVERARVDEHDAHVIAREEVPGEHRVAAAVGLPGREVGGSGRGLTARVLRRPRSATSAASRDGPGRSSPSCRPRGRLRGRPAVRSRPRSRRPWELDRDRLAAARVPADERRAAARATSAMRPSGATPASPDAGRTGARGGDDHERGTDGGEWQPAAGRGWHRPPKCATPMRSGHRTVTAQ